METVIADAGPLVAYLTGLLTTDHGLRDKGEGKSKV